MDVTERAMMHSLLLCLTLLLLFQALRSFKLTVTVDPKYHPKIIGRKGAVITQIRTEHEVNIQFPDFFLAGWMWLWVAWPGGWWPCLW